MTKPSEKIEDTGKAARKVQQETRERLDKAKEKVSPKATVSVLFTKFMKDFAQLSTKERIKRISEIIFVATIGKLIGNERTSKRELEAEAEENEDSKPKETTTPSESVNNNENSLPEDLSGVKYESENILKCKNAEQCRVLMKANGFVLDQNSGNYINPRWLSPEKILREPLVEASIGGKKIKLKRSVMKRLKTADEKMFKETGEHIKVGEHFRSNARQFELFMELKPKNARVAMPG